MGLSRIYLSDGNSSSMLVSLAWQGLCVVLCQECESRSKNGKDDRWMIRRLGALGIDRPDLITYNAGAAEAVGIETNGKLSI
jgi:hypothetical protein